MQFIESCRHLLRFLREIPVEREQLIPSNFTVLDVFVDDKEAPLVRPNVP